MLFICRDFLKFNTPCDGYLVAFKIKMIGDNLVKYIIHDSSGAGTTDGTMDVDGNSTLKEPLQVYKGGYIRLHSDTKIALYQVAGTTHGVVTHLNSHLDDSQIPMVGIALYFKGRFT